MKHWLILIVLFLFSISSPTQTVNPPGKDYSFQVPANQAWTDTGLDLESGQTVHISAVSGCGATSGNQEGSLPVPSAPSGSLIAKLNDAATPVSAPAGTDLQVSKASHLYLGPNGGQCNGTLTVKLHVTPVGSSNSAEQSSESQRLKQQLGNAAEIFMQGQFGVSGKDGNSVTGSAEPLKVSDEPLDASLRKDIDAMPRRVNDKQNNQGDMVNFVLVGSQAQVQAALTAADWHLADTSDRSAVFAAVEATYQQKDYLSMPMSTLYLFGRAQDFGYEEAEPIAMVASRNHFRLWKAPFTWNGQTIWVGAGTHDIGFAKDQRNGSITHKIDPNVDGERTNIGQTLDKSGKVKNLHYYLPPNPVQEAKVATGDTYHSDGRILVVFLKE
jgi:LssY C-terminus